MGMKDFSMARPTPAQFIRQVRLETAKVTWPSRKETVITTIMVFIMVIFASIFLFIVDQVVGFLVRTILGMGG
jgi:preprotein translocase subunit SecE